MFLFCWPLNILLSLSNYDPVYTPLLLPTYHIVASCSIFPVLCYAIVSVTDTITQLPPWIYASIQPHLSHPMLLCSFAPVISTLYPRPWLLWLLCHLIVDCWHHPSWVFHFMNFLRTSYRLIICGPFLRIVPTPGCPAFIRLLCNARNLNQFSTQIYTFALLPVLVEFRPLVRLPDWMVQANNPEPIH